jgi:hypothetical protein
MHHSQASNEPKKTPYAVMTPLKIPKIIHEKLEF